MKRILKKFFAVLGYDMFPRHTIAADARQIRTILTIDRMYQRMKDVSGSIVECGVGRGRTFLYCAYLNFEEGKKRKLWGFDSFEGFPEPSVLDQTDRKPKKGDWSGISTSDIVGILKTAGLHDDFINETVRLEKGFFDVSLSRYDKKPIAFLHIDVDLYESYKTVLATLFPYVSKGGIVLFDEYKDPRWPGAEKAVDEFLKGTEYHPILDSRSGKYYIVK